tara:strand:+ start:719 stop:1045 length:327 start_codon:yes stop_codon:yes gene_type:complete
MKKVIAIESDNFELEGIFSSAEMAWNFFVSRYNGNQIISKKDFLDQIGNGQEYLIYNNPVREYPKSFQKYSSYFEPGFGGSGAWNKGDYIDGIKFISIGIDEELERYK